MNNSLAGPQGPQGPLGADARQAVSALQGARRILVFYHVSPDGDAIGSTLALVQCLRALGKEAWAVLVDPIPTTFQFLPNIEVAFTPWQNIVGQWDLAVCLDCGDLSRVGAALPLLSACANTLNIDHHATNSRFGTYNWVENRAAAVGEMIFRLIAALGQSTDAAIATALLTAIMTDTGGFQYEATSDTTLHTAAALVRAGARLHDVAQAIWENESLGRTRLLGSCLNTLALHGDGRVATLTVTRAMLAAAGAGDEDVDGLVNHARAIRGVEVGILLRETADQAIRVNLRSRRAVDVGQVALAFGGGGHPRAAGCTLPGPLEAALPQVVAAVTAVLPG